MLCFHRNVMFGYTCTCTYSNACTNCSIEAVQHIHVHAVREIGMFELHISKFNNSCMCIRTYMLMFGLHCHPKYSASIPLMQSTTSNIPPHAVPWDHECIACLQSACIVKCVYLWLNSWHRVVSVYC